MISYDYLYDKEYYIDELKKDHFRDCELSWRVIPGAVVLPYRELTNGPGGGLLDEDGSYVDGSGIHSGLGCAYDISDEETYCRDEDAVFLGVWPRIWGHCLTDNIRRLWVLHDKGFMERYGKLRFLYIPFQGVEPDANCRELLHALGADNIRLEPVSQALRFRNVILPDECFWREPDGTRMFTSEYRKMIDAVRKYGEDHPGPAKDKKLYFTYRNHPAMRTIGEKKLERFFSARGFRIISPERYSFSEQLDLLLNCEEFACTVGSASHNNIFLRDGTKVYLIPRAGFISEYQPALDQLHELSITYIDSSLSLYAKPGREWDGPFYYIISRPLRECFGYKGRYREDKIAFSVYRMLAYAMNGVTEPLNYYKKVCSEYLSRDPKRAYGTPLMARLMRSHRVRRIINRYMG